MNLTDFQTKIQARIKAATGLDDGHVIWANQTRDRPTRPFVELAMLADETHAHPEHVEGTNPSGQPSQAAFNAISGFPWFQPGSIVRAVAVGPVGNTYVISVTARAGAGAVVVTWNPTGTVDIPGVPVLDLNCQSGTTNGVALAAALIAWVAANPGIVTLENVVGKTSPFVNGNGVVGTGQFSGGTTGNEILLTTRHQVELTVQVRAFSGEVVGSLSAPNVARNIRNYLGRDSVSVAFAADGIAVVDRGPVRDATIVLSTEHEGRGILDLKFRVADLDTETTTYIETAKVETTIEQSNGNVTRTLTITQP